MRDHAISSDAQVRTLLLSVELFLLACIFFFTLPHFYISIAIFFGILYLLSVRLNALIS